MDLWNQIHQSIWGRMNLGSCCLGFHQQWNNWRTIIALGTRLFRSSHFLSYQTQIPFFPLQGQGPTDCRVVRDSEPSLRQGSVHRSQHVPWKACKHRLSSQDSDCWWMRWPYQSPHWVDGPCVRWIAFLRFCCFSGFISSLLSSLLHGSCWPLVWKCSQFALKLARLAL